MKHGTPVIPASRGPHVLTGHLGTSFVARQQIAHTRLVVAGRRRDPRQHLGISDVLPPGEVGVEQRLHHRYLPEGLPRRPTHEPV